MRKILSVLLAFLVVGVFTFTASAQKKTPKYVGSKKCKMCHNSKKSGGQYKIWLGTAHAKAFDVLASEEAKAVAKKKGIADPQKSDQCLSCHVTGYGKDASMFAASFKQTEGVGCESCHGPGSVYKSMRIMKGIAAGKMQAADYSLVIPDEKQCVTCHNEKSPTYKAFDFKTFWAKIAHPTPKK